MLQFDRFLVYYGAWDAAIVSRVNHYDLIVLDVNNGPALAEQRPIIDAIQAGVDGLSGTETMSGFWDMCRSARMVVTYNHAAAAVGDGRGPCYFNRQTAEVVYENKGVASYYMDEWDVNGPLGHGRWNMMACRIETGVGGLLCERRGYQLAGLYYRRRACQLALWLRYRGEYDRMQRVFPGYAGSRLALGTVRMDVEGASRPDCPAGCHLPDKLLLLNRGLFFFVPQNPEQYKWCPRKHIDIVLFESYYLDSAYEEGFDYHLSPWFNMNRYYSSPKLNAELGRPDSYCPIVNIDYCRTPDAFPVSHSAVYSNTLQQSVCSQGRVELVTDRMVTSLDNPVFDYPPPPDRNAPVWDNTTSGYLFLNEGALDYESIGTEDASERSPRVGLQKAIPGNGQVTCDGM